MAPTITCNEDLRRLAKRRVPRAIFDYVDRGSYDELTIRANRAALDRILLRQREDSVKGLIELDAVAVQFTDEEGSLLRCGLAKRVLERCGNLRGLAPRLGLVVGAARVRPCAPRVAFPLAFLEVETAEGRQQAFARCGVSGGGESLDETGDDFGPVHHRK